MHHERRTERQHFEPGEGQYQPRADQRESDAYGEYHECERYENPQQPNR